MRGDGKTSIHGFTSTIFFAICVERRKVARELNQTRELELEAELSLSLSLTVTTMSYWIEIVEDIYYILAG